MAKMGIQVTDRMQHPKQGLHRAGGGHLERLGESEKGDNMIQKMQPNGCQKSALL